MSIVARLFVAIILLAGLCATWSAGAASAADTGGNGNPLASCPNAYTVASAPITSGGRQVGLVELRWSWACSGNWARTTSYVGVRTLTSVIQIGVPPYNPVATGQDNAAQNFSPFLRVAPTQRMCAHGYIAGVGDVGLCSN